eukprot:8795_1
MSEDSTTNQLTVVLLVETCLNFVAMLCFGTSFLSLVINFYCRSNDKAKRIINFIRYSTIIYSFLYCISFIIAIIMSIDEYSELTKDDNLNYLTSSEYARIYVINNTIWSIARVSFFILWVGRHYYSFEGSVYQSKKITYILLISGVILMFLVLMFINIVILALGYVDNNSNILLSLVLTFGILEFIIATSIIYLFVHKLFQLILDTTQYEEIIDAHYTQKRLESISIEPQMQIHYDDRHVELGVVTNRPEYTIALNSANVNKHNNIKNGKHNNERLRGISSASTLSLFKRWQSFASVKSESGTINDINVKLEARQIILINTITQHSILGGIALISSQIYLFMFLIYMFDFNIIQSHFTANLLLSCYRPIDRIIQVFCIYISLNFSHNIYKFCCKKTHNGLRKLCQNIAKNKIKKMLVKKENDLSYQLLLAQ